MNNALCLDDWTVTKVDNQSKTVRVISARYDIHSEYCPKCGVVGRLYRHGAKDIRYTDAPAYCKQTLIVASVARYRCRDCGATSMQPLPDIDDKRQMTRRCVELIESKAAASTHMAVSREVGVDEKTIRSINLLSYERRLAEREIEAPEVLGIDELTLAGRKRTIFVDVYGRRALDVLDTMNSTNVNRWLSMLPKITRTRVITVDMWGPYMTSVRQYMPNAAIVVDKFHVFLHLHGALDKVRNRNRRERGIKKNPHRARRLLQASRHKLKPKAKAKLEELLAANPLLRSAWDCKEQFRDIYESKTRQEAEKRFDEWKRTIPKNVALEFAPKAAMIEDFRNEIFAYFDHRLTNAFTESMNGIIKMINRAGRGYSFDVIRARILLIDPLGEVGECDFCHNIMSVKRLKAAPKELNGGRICKDCLPAFHTQGDVAGGVFASSTL